MGCWRVGRDSRVGFRYQALAECSNRPLWMLDQEFGMERTDGRCAQRMDGGFTCSFGARIICHASKAAVEAN